MYGGPDNIPVSSSASSSLSLSPIVMILGGIAGGIGTPRTLWTCSFLSRFLVKCVHECLLLGRDLFFLWRRVISFLLVANCLRFLYTLCLLCSACLWRVCARRRQELTHPLQQVFLCHFCLELPVVSSKQW